MRNLIIIFFILNSINCFSQDKIKNIFDPNNINTNSQKTNIITKNFDFTLYGIINTKEVKKVIIKPKIYTREIKKKMNKHKYIILKIGEEFQNIKLISIDNDTAKFKKGDKIISMRVFQNVKNDRVNVVNNQGPIIINNQPQTLPKKISTFQKNIKNRSKINTKKKNKNFFIIPNKKNRKLTSNKNKVNNTNKKPVNPFLELLKKAKKQNNQNLNHPVTNPFLQLLKRAGGK